MVSVTVLGWVTELSMLPMLHLLLVTTVSDWATVLLTVSVSPTAWLHMWFPLPQ